MCETKWCRGDCEQCLMIEKIEIEYTKEMQTGCKPYNKNQQNAKKKHNSNTDS